MIRFLCAGRPLFGCLLSVLVLPAGTWAAPPDPLDAEAATPALSYQSPLRDFQGLSAEPVQDWREANDLVGRIGGWRIYAQEPWEEPAADQAGPGRGHPAEPHANHGR